MIRKTASKISIDKFDAKLKKSKINCNFFYPENTKELHELAQSVFAFQVELECRGVFFCCCCCFAIISAVESLLRPDKGGTFARPPSSPAKHSHVHKMYL